MLLLLGMGIAVHAQFSGSSGMIKTSAGYAHDFPGLNGYTFGAEYGFPLTPFLQGGIGMKHANMQGYPRSIGHHSAQKRNCFGLALVILFLYSIYKEHIL